MLCPHAIWSPARILLLADAAAAVESEASEAEAPGGRLSSAATPGVSQIPNGEAAVTCASCIWSCWARTSAEIEELKTVASAATETACTTKRVLFNREEPRGRLFNGTLLNAATNEVCRVKPTARPRSASRKSMYEMGVVASIWESCQVLMHRMVKPTIRFIRGPILS